MTVQNPKVLILAAVTSADTVPALLALDLSKAASLARQEKAKATRRAYASDVEIFDRWCTSRGVSALPAMAEAVAAFLACDAIGKNKGAQDTTGAFWAPVVPFPYISPHEVVLSTVTTRRFCDQHEISLQTATGRSLP